MLPKRHTSAAMQEGVLRSAEVLSKAHVEQGQKTPLGWKVLALALPAVMVTTLILKDRGEARAQTRVNFSESAIVSADLAGVRASAQELVSTPAPDAAHPSAKESPKELLAATGVPSAPPVPPPARGGHRDAGRPRLRDSEVPPRPPAPAEKECRKCELTKLGLEEPTEVLADFAEDLVAPESSPKRMPVGTRIPVTLTQPVTTSVEGTPVTGEVRDDVVLDARVIVPAGSRVEGLAFASEQDDRARIVFTSLVVDGQSVGVAGLALNEKNEVGLEANVVKKGSKSKRASGGLLRALGSAATLGLVGRSGSALAPLTYSVGGEVNRGLQGMTRDWAVSDKALRVNAGSVAIVYLRSDVVVP